MSERNITFEIKEHLGVIAEFDSGWNKELNIISWNGNTPKYDIRDWDAHHERMRKGVTLHEAEFRRLVDLYLHNCSQKAVELGRNLEAERKQRRREQAEAREKSRDTAEADSLTAEYSERRAGPCSESRSVEEIPEPAEEAIRELCKAEIEAEETAALKTDTATPEIPAAEADSEAGAAENPSLSEAGSDVPF